MAAVEHYLPQFLLRGFSARITRGRHYVYQFRRGGAPHLANARDVAGERGFYGTVGAADVEPALSARENEYAPLMQRLRSDGVKQEDRPLIDALVLHLLVRGRHLRESAVEVVTTTIDGMARGLRSREAQSALFLSGLERSAQFRTLIASCPPERRSMFRQMVVLFAQQAAESGAIDALLGQAFEHLRSHVNIPEIVRGAQGEALLRWQSAFQARPGLTGFAWDIRRSPLPMYILGDIGVVAYYSLVGFTHPISRRAGELQALFLPISSSVLLVGAVPDAPMPDDGAVNMASAELSRHFYVAANNGPRESEYLPFLGNRAVIVDETTMDEWVREVLDEQHPAE